jgi:membrane protease YdiL (CAAX protease family)
MQNFTLKEKIILIIGSIIGVSSLLVIFLFNNKIDPKFNINFDLDRKEAEIKARGFLDQQNIDLNDYRSTTIFNENSDTQFYLNKEIPVTETSRLANNQINVWDFRTRFFKPLNFEEYKVGFMPNGRLSYFERTFKAQEEGAKLNKDQALKKAEEFLKNFTIWEPNNLEIIEFKEEKLDQRSDYKFTFEVKNLKIKESTYQINLELAGEKIKNYSENLEIPNTWLRNYQKIRSKNDLATSVADMLTFLVLILPLLIYFVIYFTKHKLNYKLALFFSITAVIINFISAINSIPLSIYDYYQTESSWIIFNLNYYFEALLQSITIGTNFINGGLSIFIITAAGEAIYNRVFDNKLSLNQLFKGGLKTKEACLALFIGSFFAFFDLAFVAVYYYFGQKLGFWSPTNIDYNELLSTKLPWIYPLLIGFLAAVSEEGIFRLFGISFLKKKLKWSFLAILIVSLIFGFIHANYPQEPWFVRGLEIAISSIILGFLFLRFGFLAALSWHYTHNAFSGAMYFFNNYNFDLTQAIISVFIGILPLILAFILLIFKLFKGSFKNPASLMLEEKRDKSIEKKSSTLNQPDGKKNKLKSTYQPTLIAGKIILSLLVIIGFELLLVAFNPNKEISPKNFSASKTEIYKKAQNEFKKTVSNSESYQSYITTFSRSPDPYLKIFLAEAYKQEMENDFENKNAFYKTNPDYLKKENTKKNLFEELIKDNWVKTIGWKVRFFKPEQKEEYLFYYLGNGELYSKKLILKETTPLSELTQEKAKQIAEDFLSQEKKLDLEKLSLKETTSEKKPNRTEHSFTFNLNRYDIYLKGENEEKYKAEFQINLDVIGEKPLNYSQSIKIPEEWKKQQDQKFINLKSLIGQVVHILVYLLIIILIGAEFLILARNKLINYKKVLVVSFIILGVFILNSINQLSTFYSGYNTAIPLGSFILEELIYQVFGLIFVFVQAFFALAIISAAWKKHVGKITPQTFRKKSSHIKDGIRRGYGLAVLGAIAIVSFTLISFSMNPISGLTGYSSIPTGINAYLPFLTGITDLVKLILDWILVLMAVIILNKYLRKKYLVFILVLILVFLYALTISESLLNSIIPTIFILTALSLTYLTIKKTAKKNLIAYLFIPYAYLSLMLCFDYLSESNNFLKFNGYLMLLVALLPWILFYVLKFLAWRRKK